MHYVNLSFSFVIIFSIQLSHDTWIQKTIFATLSWMFVSGKVGLSSENKLIKNYFHKGKNNQKYPAIPSFESGF